MKPIFYMLVGAICVAAAFACAGFVGAAAAAVIGAQMALTDSIIAGFAVFLCVVIAAISLHAIGSAVCIIFSGGYPPGLLPSDREDPKGGAR